MKFFEPLSGGLNTKVHEDLIQEGQLSQAVNSEYEPDDGGLRVAKGRAKCGTLTAASAPITHLAALSWDPGTLVDGSQEELKQVIFLKNGATSGPLYSVPLKDVPSDPAYDTARSYSLPSGEVASWGDDGIEIVAFENDYFILPGTDENYWLYRRIQGGAMQQFLAKHGLPGNTVDLVGFDFAAGFPSVAPVGFYMWWFTWYDSVRDLESGRGPVAFWLDVEDNNTWPPSIGHRNFAKVTGNISAVTANVNAAEYNAAKPATADKIRIYRSKMFDNDQLDSPVPLGDQWPIGVLIEERSSTLPVSGIPGELTLLLDNFLLTNDGVKRRGAVAILSSNAGQPFDIATLFGVSVDADAEPPPASTGCRFEDSLVLNDMRDPRKIWYSVPGEPHSFPSLYFLNMDTSETDEVVSLRTLGNRMFVGMREAVWKVNWLPFEGDIDGARGRVREVVSAKHGVVNRKAVALFDMEQLGPVVAWVSRTGVYATDLDTEIHLTRDVDWETLVPDPSNAILVNNIQKKRLEMAYGENREKVLYISYAGGIRITGPILRPGQIHGMVEGITDTGRTVILTTDQDGFIFQEGAGTEDASTGLEMEMSAKTRAVYPDAFGDEVRFNRLCFHADGQGTATVTAKVKGKRGLASTVSSATATLVLPDEPLVTAPCSKHGEKVQFEITASGPVRVNFVGGLYEGQGDVERS